jgi:predicted dehydrogenase
MPTRIGIGLVGAGWMGNVHSHAYRSIPSCFGEAGLEPVLVRVVDEEAAVARAAQERWGYADCDTDWRSVVADPAVDVVDVTAPNDVHLEVALAAVAAGKHVYCEKPVGRSLEETARIAEAARAAGVTTFTGFNYRWMPALQHARRLVEDGRLGALTHFRSVFLTDWGASAQARFSWRFDRASAGWGALGDVASHVVDTAEVLVGPIDEVIGAGEIFVPERPAPVAASTAGTSVFGELADPGAERVAVTNEDYFAALLRFRNGARGTLEASRAVAGPRSRFRLELHGTDGAFAWDLERMNEFELYLSGDERVNAGYRRVVVGPEHPDFAAFSPGAGAGIAFQDSKTIEALRFLEAVASGVPREPSFATALRVASVLDALERSWQTGAWQSVEVPAPALAR